MSRPEQPAIRRNESSALLVLTAILLLLSATAGNAAEPAAIDRSHHLRIFGDAQKAESARKLARHCSLATTRFLGLRETPASWLEIHLAAPSAAGAAATPATTVFVPPDASMGAALHGIALACVRRGAPQTAPANGGDWLAAAVVFHTLSTSTAGTVDSDFDYRAARRSFQAGKFPSVNQLLTLPLPPSADMLYALYSLHCHLFVNLLSRSAPRQPNPVASLISRLAAGETPETALAAVLGKTLSAGETPQEWYERQAPAFCRRGRRGGCSAEEIMANLEETLQLTVMLPGADGAPQVIRVPLAELPEKMRELKLPAQGLGVIEAELFELAKDAPPLLRTAVLEHVAAVQLLRQGKTGRFHGQLKIAGETATAAAAKHAKVSKLLDHTEDSHGFSAGKLAEYLRINERISARERELSPEISKLLDATAAKF